MRFKKNDELLYPRLLSQATVSHLPSALVPARTPIQGALVTLEPQDAQRHAQALYDVSHNTAEGLAVWDYLPEGPWPDSTAYQSVLREQSASLDPVHYTICENNPYRICGQMSFMELRPQHGCGEIGYIWFDPKLQQTKAATEVFFLAMNYLMSDLGYRRLQWKCDAFNQRSRKAALRLGFRFEGIHYNHVIVKGNNRDTAWYSILDDEWPEVQDNLKQWLSDDNFNTQGQPKRSLTAMMQQRTPSTRCP